jgi:hypothetical protein
MNSEPQCRYCGERFSNAYNRNVHEAEDCSEKDAAGTRGGGR